MLVGELCVLRPSLWLTTHPATMALRTLASDCHSYEETIRVLNSLQSNASYIQEARKQQRSYSVEAQKLSLTRDYLEMLGLGRKELSKLSVIHISGTKGKGSTSAYCESMLRHNNFRTGFFTSPHLVSVCERIQINGQSLSNQKFISYFWEVYSTITKNKDPEMIMPPYFTFLTIMAFKVFIGEQVDVAIVEVGIGGEFDNTNVLEDVSVVGITSLGMDHLSLLGNTLSSIAWQKSGILKPSAIGFTVPGHAGEALKVLGERSVERECPLAVVPPLEKFSWPDTDTREAALSLFPVQQVNASLALHLSYAWMQRQVNPLYGKDIQPAMMLKEAEVFTVTKELAKGLLSCRWPGRMQILSSSCSQFTYFLDGAHTLESIEACVDWFLKTSQNGSNVRRALIVNLTGDREAKDMFKKLLTCSFDKVVFSPNLTYTSVSQGDNTNLRFMQSDQLLRVESLHSLWNSLSSSMDANGCVSKFSPKKVACVSEALSDIHSSEGRWNVLVTGSLHLVGAALCILDPKLENSMKN